MAGRRGGVVVPISTEFNSRGLQQANQQLNNFGKSITRKFTGIGATLGATVAGGLAIGAAVDITRQMVDAGSRLQESQSKVNVVFGDSARQINAWAETAATSMVMSKQAAMEAAGTFGNLFQAFGIGQGKALTMSTTLVQLAADLASFNNTSTEDAITALRSGLSGETEPLKRYGVALNDARLKAEAFNMGIYDGKGMLDAQQKSLAAYAVIMKDTKLAQGDVARTSDNYANSMRALSAGIEDASAKIGGEFVRALTEMNKAMGGPEGSVALIDESSSSMAGFVRLLSDASTEALKLANSNESASLNLGDLAKGWAMNIPPLAIVIDQVGRFTDIGKESMRIEQELNDEIARSVQMRHLYATAVKVSSDALRVDTEWATKSTEAQNKLNGALERRNDKNRSIIGANIRLRELRATGPQDRNGDKKISMDERKAFGLDYASTIDSKYNALISQGRLKKAQNLLSNARDYLGNQVSDTFAGNILGTPKALPEAITARKRAASEAGANQWRQSMSNVFSVDTINVYADNPAEAVQKAKEYVRMAALDRNPMKQGGVPGLGPSRNPFKSVGK